MATYPGRGHLRYGTLQGARRTMKLYLIGVATSARVI